MTRCRSPITLGLGAEAHTGVDALLGYIYELRPFELDTAEYCEQRAVAAFNAAGPMVKWYKKLDPSAQSTTCHVAQCVVPRQVQLTQTLPSSPTTPLL